MYGSCARPHAIERQQIADACDSWRGLSSSTAAAASGPPSADPPAPFWLLRTDGATTRALPLSDWSAAGGAAAAAAGSSSSSGGGSPRGAAPPTLMLAFSDPSHLPRTPGWPLRNLLLLAAARWGIRTVSVLCVRDGKGRLDVDRSFVIDVELPEVAAGWGGVGEGVGPDAVGWEPNASGKLAPRWVCRLAVGGLGR